MSWQFTSYLCDDFYDYLKENIDNEPVSVEIKGSKLIVSPRHEVKSEYWKTHLSSNGTGKLIFNIGIGNYFNTVMWFEGEKDRSGSLNTEKQGGIGCKFLWLLRHLLMKKKEQRNCLSNIDKMVLFLLNDVLGNTEKDWAKEQEMWGRPIDSRYTWESKINEWISEFYQELS